jgi:hypothetical protein
VKKENLIDENDVSLEEQAAIFIKDAQQWKEHDYINVSFYNLA